MREIFRHLVDHAPAHVLRLVAGGALLGLVLMLFLKVLDEAFGLPVVALNWIAVGVTGVFAVLLCWGLATWSERCVNFLAGSIVIFAVGLTSNNVVADMKHNLGLSADAPDEVESYEMVIAQDD